MKYIKTFESYFQPDEYVSAVTDILKSYNLMPDQINKIIDSYSDTIEQYYNDGKYPQVFINSIKDQLELTSGGFPSMIGDNSGSRTIKYL